MASSNDTSKSEGNGAAEEPGPGPDNPDDRGGADGTPRKKGEAQVKSKDKAQGKTKDGKGKTVGRCGNCDAEGAKMKCSQCGTEVYCDENCQRVRGSRVSARGGRRCHGSYARRALTPFRIVTTRPTQEHWKYGGHKKACKAYVLADTVQAQQQRLCQAAVETAKCMICFDSLRDPTTLPCEHSFCTGCGLPVWSEGQGVSAVCDLCGKMMSD